VRPRSSGREAVDTLIVAEAPPQDEERYFYYESVEEHDSRFRYLAREVLGVIPSRQNKGELLGSLRERGIFLIDPDAVEGLRREDVLSRVRVLDPDRAPDPDGMLVQRIDKLSRIPEPARRDEIGPLWKRSDIEKWAEA
jgi:hypothetical protein